MRAAKTQDSLGIRPVCSESSLCTVRVANDLNFHQSDSEDWPDWADGKADLSLRFPHRSFCCLVLLLKQPRFNILDHKHKISHRLNIVVFEFHF